MRKGEIDFGKIGTAMKEMGDYPLWVDDPKGMTTQAMAAIREQPPRNPSRLDRSLRGDLETITLKALAREPDRRYQSAAALAADLDHFLRDEPIVARPVSWIYRVRRSLSHYRLRSALSVVAAVLAVIWIWQLTRPPYDMMRARLSTLVKAGDRMHSLQPYRGYPCDLLAGSPNGSKSSGQ